MMDTPVEIRLTVATDLPRLMGMDHSTHSEYVWQVDLHREPGQVSVNLREVRLPRPISVPYPRNPFALADEWQLQSLMLTAVLANPVGYICVNARSAGEVVWVTDLVVAPEVRQRGVGAALLKAVETWALERGSRVMFFEMMAKNHPAIRMARKFGFEFCGYNDHYYASHDVTLFFGRGLG